MSHDITKNVTKRIRNAPTMNFPSTKTPIELACQAVSGVTSPAALEKPLAYPGYDGLWFAYAGCSACHLLQPWSQHVYHGQSWIVHKEIIRIAGCWVWLLFIANN